MLESILNINNEAFKIFFVSMLPITELRFSIPYFILVDNLMWQKVYIISVLGNILIGIVILYIIAPGMFIIKKYNYFKKIINYILRRTKTKSKIINNYKLFGLILFIGIPLPLTGVWTGALASYLFSIPRKKAIIGIVVGILISSIIMLSLTLLGKEMHYILK